MMIQPLRWQYNHIDGIFINVCIGNWPNDMLQGKALMKILSAWWHFHLSDWWNLSFGWPAITLTHLPPVLHICVNSLAPGGFENIFQNVFFKLISWIDTLSNSCETALRSMPQNPSDDKSTLVQVMAWCRQAASHYLSQCCPRSLSPYGVTRPQWVNASGQHLFRYIVSTDIQKKIQALFKDFFKDIFTVFRDIFSVVPVCCNKEIQGNSTKSLICM